MDYPLENLSPEKFQLFCQALLAKEFPGLQCMPVSQPDGGRDAIQYTPGTKSGMIVFQIKFVRKPQAEKDPHKWLEGIIVEEMPKIKQLIAVGAKQYVLLTNVPGTGHPDSGSIDTVNSLLSKQLEIPAVCWWRNEICRRLDDAWNLKWVYPELMTGPDLIRTIIETGLSENKERRASAIRAFITHQYTIEQEVKFKQVELQNRLLDLFIDVPIQSRWEYTYTSPMPYERRITSPAFMIASEDAREEDDYLVLSQYESQSMGAASFLLNGRTQKNRCRIVLEGAPGQGKSTISQYLCQVHRMRLLGKINDLAQIAKDHRTAPVRLPIKVDLRDFASWIEAKNPFTAEGEKLIGGDWNKSLEGFLAALIKHNSGGAQFDVSDLHAILRLSSILIVLDGLDEVADIRRRADVVEEIEKGVARLESNAASLQVIVTSRPAAFANSPGLSEKKFEYFSLTSVNLALIEQYADKWVKARRMEDRESASVKKTLQEKLEQPHIRDLARNPMQLAILLSLVHTRGPSLPDKRTALYDAYIDLFFSREAEKSTMVRDYRDLLIDIHRYLAWLLHTESEAGTDNPAGNKKGSFTSERLVHVLKKYLDTEGRDPKLAEILFTGVAERVMALVSRVQGTYEFEVQPLREYFAARFLFETAPYSPTGREKRGTRPDRFDAICRNFYWLNVTRFYAGCYSKGELSSLIDRLIELVKDKRFKLLSHPRTLAATLLADYVFSQHPKSVREVVRLILDDLGLRFVLTSNSRRVSRGEPLVLPKDCGNSELVDRCFTLLDKIPPADYVLDVIDLLKANADLVQIFPIWKDRLEKMEGQKRFDWLFYGLHLGCISNLDNAELKTFFGDLIDNGLTLDILIKGRRVEFLEATPERFDSALEVILERRIFASSSWRNQSLLELIGHTFDVSRYAMSFEAPENSPLSTVWKRRAGKTFIELKSIPDVAVSNDSITKCIKIAKVMFAVIAQDANNWARTLAPWETLVEAIRSEFGDCWAIMNLANVAAGIRSTTETCTDSNELFDRTHSLCRRARYARLRAGSAQWWALQLSQSQTQIDKMFLSLLWLTWSSAATLKQNVVEVNKIVDGLNDIQWKQLFDSLNDAMQLTRMQSGDRVIELDFEKFPSHLSAKMWTLLQLRAKPTCSRWLYLNRLHSYSGDDVRILKVLQDAAVKALISDSESASFHVNIIEKAFSKGVISMQYSNYHFTRYSSINSLPLDVANKITESANLYPAFLVAAAEAVCRQVAAENVRPVALIAEEEGWFRH